MSKRWMRFILWVWLAIALCFLPPFIAPGQATEPPALEQQSRSHYEAGRYLDAIELLQQAIERYQSQGDTLRQAIALGNLALVYRQTNNWTEANAAIDRSLDLLPPESPASALAQILDIQAQLQLAQGQAQQALATWERAAHLYEQAEDRSGTIRAQINQAQALQELGLIRRSIALLTDLRQTLPPDSAWLAIVQHRLGDALIVTGNLQQARINLEPLGDATSDLRLSLGNLLRAEALMHLGFRNLLPSEAIALLAQSDPSANRRQVEAAQQFMQETQSAIDRYQQAARSTDAPEIRFQARLNALSLLIEPDDATLLNRWRLKCSLRRSSCRSIMTGFRSDWTGAKSDQAHAVQLRPAPDRPTATNYASASRSASRPPRPIVCAGNAGRTA
ncbi:MAG: tetratricopeptide repeat protein [Leptolyngbyaceae cyanobacterium SM1_3_5]|nr:tetratricopeptide repeat protein [Leptolyngbyaceae cyanobacterium SM1_3_5]